MAKHALDWSLVPGTKAEQRSRARRTGKPIEIRKDGGRWAVLVFDIPLGHLPTKAEAQHAAHFIGRYKLELGDFVYAYTKGYE